MPDALERFKLYYEELPSAAQFKQRKKVKNGKNPTRTRRV